MTTITIPASTSNLGPGFDTLGLALELYLTLEIAATDEPFGSFRFKGEGAAELGASTEENLIFRAMRLAAERQETELRPANITVDNQIPLARGLGSSGAAVIAGLSAFEVIAGHSLPPAKLLEYAAELEGHSDNVSASLLGSFVVSSMTDEGAVHVARLDWPDEVRAVVVIPNMFVKTEKARAVLPASVSRADAVHNVQHSSMLVAAIASGQPDLIRGAMQDRLHQPYRMALVPGLAEILALGERALADVPGCLGTALSGSGPTVLALATENFENIANAIQGCFSDKGVESKSMVLGVACEGRQIAAQER